jgi:glucose-6-phosphate isomerase
MKYKKKWFLETMKQQDVAKHFVTQFPINIEKVTNFGINPDNVLPMWDWVGGRFHCGVLLAYH